MILGFFSFIGWMFIGLAALVGAFRSGGLILKAINRFFDWLGGKLS